MQAGRQVGRQAGIPGDKAGPVMCRQAGRQMLNGKMGLGVRNKGVRRFGFKNKGAGG